MIVFHGCLSLVLLGASVTAQPATATPQVPIEQSDVIAEPVPPAVAASAVAKKKAKHAAKKSHKAKKAAKAASSM